MAAKKQKGFHLIEVIVAILLLSLLFYATAKTQQLTTTQQKDNQALHRATLFLENLSNAMLGNYPALTKGAYLDGKRAATDLSVANNKMDYCPNANCPNSQAQANYDLAALAVTLATLNNATLSIVCLDSQANDDLPCSLGSTQHIQLTWQSGNGKNKTLTLNVKH